MHCSACVLFFIYIFKSTSSDLLIETKTGPIQGVSSLSEDVEAFLGVPYAEPPVGELRFAKPIPKKPWSSVLHASKMPPPCPQISFGYHYYAPNLQNMSEDCLYLNIWATKPISKVDLKPVIMYIHPGGFIFGSSNLYAYDGSNLARRGDVVVVTINHRLGPFGFLLAYIEEANGNMGMYDQVMAIRWVKDNAMAFGGDPENIVLMGESSGAASVAAHMMSPVSKNLFHKAVILSGGMIIPFFYDNNTRLFGNSESVASLTGCANETVNLKTHPHSVVDCLKRQPVESFVEAVNRIVLSQAAVFFPRIGDEYLPYSPSDLLHKGEFNADIPVLTGINSNEGSIFLAVGMPEYFGNFGHNMTETISKNFASFMARSLFGILKVTNPTEVVNYYTRTVKNKTAVGYTKMMANIFGDYAINCNTIFQADLFTNKGSSVYFYIFGFRSPKTILADWMGTTHMDQMQYIFGVPYHGHFTDEDVNVRNRVMDRLSAFAKTGDPNIPGEVSWIPYSHKSPKYLSIEQEEEVIRSNPVERCKIWRTRFKGVIN